MMLVATLEKLATRQYGLDILVVVRILFIRYYSSHFFQLGLVFAPFPFRVQQYAGQLLVVE
jgi:hypothetical protein